MNRGKTISMAIAALFVASTANAGFFLVDGKTRGAAVKESMGEARLIPGEAKDAPPRKVSGKFAFSRCETDCSAPVAKPVALLRIPVNASVKAADLAKMKEMKRVLIQTDGTEQGRDKAVAIKDLIGKGSVLINAEGKEPGYLLIREGD